MYKKIRSRISNIFWYLYVRHYRRMKKRNNNIIFCECFVSAYGKKLRKNNWGDDLNKVFFEYVTNQKFIFVPYNRFLSNNKDIHYSLIGSIIGFYNLDSTIIYGSGIIRPSVNIVGKPLNIISVRGPKTRSVLLNKGIECPERYGDPALLLPVFYKPTIKKLNQICIIPHMGTDLYKVNKWVDKNRQYFEGVSIIDMHSYSDWREVINQISKSTYVISESLHGLIVAETYGIPSVWVEFVEHKEHWSFKFEDFYCSIGKYHEASIKLYLDNDINNIFNAVKGWKVGNINYDEMLKDFPFELSDSFKHILEARGN